MPPPSVYSEPNTDVWGYLLVKANAGIVDRQPWVRELSGTHMLTATENRM